MHKDDPEDQNDALRNMHGEIKRPFVLDYSTSDCVIFEWILTFKCTLVSENRLLLSTFTHTGVEGDLMKPKRTECR